MRLSHTGKEMYITCPQKWKLYYQDKLRSTLIGSALIFGSAIDDALNRMLLEKKRELTEEEKASMEFTPEATFVSSFSQTRVANEIVRIATSDQAMYYKSDLDIDLLDDADYKDIKDFGEEVEIILDGRHEVEEFTQECQDLFKKGVDTDTQRMYNYICWLSLKQKGLMLLEAYRKDIMPEIEETFDVQKSISLPDGDDEFVGVIDAILSFHSESGVKYVCDNKTSSRPYKQDSVQASEQLAGYAEYENNQKCAYIVLEKKLRKREPRTRTAIIKDDMPDETIDETFGKITDILENISEEKFDKNFDSCYQYGRKCAYYDYCRTGDLKNLKYTEKKGE